jgi:hypothetical protein
MPFQAMSIWTRPLCCEWQVESYSLLSYQFNKVKKQRLLVRFFVNLFSTSTYGSQGIWETPPIYLEVDMFDSPCTCQSTTGISVAPNHINIDKQVVFKIESLDASQISGTTMAA